MTFLLNKITRENKTHKKHQYYYNFLYLAANSNNKCQLGIKNNGFNNAVHPVKRNNCVNYFLNFVY